MWIYEVGRQLLLLGYYVFIDICVCVCVCVVYVVCVCVSVCCVCCVCCVCVCECAFFVHYLNCTSEKIIQCNTVPTIN